MKLEELASTMILMFIIIFIIYFIIHLYGKNHEVIKNNSYEVNRIKKSDFRYICRSNMVKARK